MLLGEDWDRSLSELSSERPHHTRIAVLYTGWWATEVFDQPHDDSEKSTRHENERRGAHVSGSPLVFMETSGRLFHVGVSDLLMIACSLRTFHLTHFFVLLRGPHL
jgi:hypothetical protein